MFIVRTAPPATLHLNKGKDIMLKIVTTSALALGIAACAPTGATTSGGDRPVAVATASGTRLFGAGDFQSFVKNWDGDGPLCARIASQADWDRYFGAAAVMGGDKPFGPPEALWTTHTTYLLARTANGGSGDVADLLKVKGVSRDARSVRIDTMFAGPASGSFQVTTYVLVAVPKPVSGTVEFREGARTFCSIRA
jgi:hypothetical protein